MDLFNLSSLIMDEYAARILLGTHAHAASAIELSRRFNIPIAACYRRIHVLQKRGLLVCENELPARNGKSLQLYRSTVRTLRIAFTDGRILARLESQGSPQPEESTLGPEDLQRKQVDEVPKW